MTLKTILTLFLITAALMAFSGCTGSPGAVPQVTVPTPEAVTPVKTPGTLATRLPSEEVARITVDHFGMNPSTEYIYEFIGKIQVGDGPYESVGVVLRYPDTQEYVYEAGGMGGMNATVKPFYFYPDQRYMGTNPEKIIALDGKRYATTYRYENGVISWVAKPENLLAP